jgi:hypothetical protein
MVMADFLDLDQWIASGRAIRDFPWPGETPNERKAIALILADRPQLAAHIGRWGTRLVEAAAHDPHKNVLEVLSEKELIDLWNETRAASLS